MSAHHQLIKNDPRWHAARRDCFDRDDWTCVDYPTTGCLGTEQLEADHIVPLSVVMADEATEHLAFDLDNLATRCKPCNGRKSDTQDNALVRGAWVNPKYAEQLAGVLGS